MDINKMMENILNNRAKTEMRSNEWGKNLDDVLTAIEHLTEIADKDQAAQMLRAGGEIKRIAKFRLKQLEKGDE